MKRIISFLLCLLMTAFAVAESDVSVKNEIEAIRTAGVGDIVTFGTYEQDGDESNGFESIEWLVMEVREDGTYVLMSVYGLDTKPYNEERTEVTWETCTLRTWLNEEFYTTAFTAEEQSLIVTVTNENKDNANYGTPGGNSTEDKVWLLSLDDVCSYYEGVGPEEDPDIEHSWGHIEHVIATPTETAITHGAYALDQWYIDKFEKKYNYPLKVGAGVWWLRSPGGFESNAARVNPDGYVDTCGINVKDDSGMIRPVVVMSAGASN